MSDSGFREIQLSGKHVVFLFIAGAVASVAIFLLGVSVGRGAARPGTAAQATPTPADAVTAAGQPAPLPPPTTPAPGELQYYGTLQGKGDAKSAVATPTASPSVSPSPAASPTASPVKPAPAPAPASKPGASAPASSSAGAVWYVQVNSFRDRANAAREVSQLKAKGISATVSTETGSGAQYKVRVGPLDKAAADAMMARLRKEGFKPSLTR